MKKTIFYLGIGLFFTHELDAVLNHEWRVLPLTSWLTEAFGRTTFVFMHVPLFAVLTALLASKHQTTRERSRFWLSAFFIIHGVLHVLFTAHKQYEFSSFQSNLLIYGAAMCGFIYLVLSRLKRNI